VAIGEDNVGEYAREQIDAVRHDPRLDRGHGGMVADFGDAVEETERVRMMSLIGLNEIRRSYECEQADFDSAGGDDQREYEVQVLWQRAELARAEEENGCPAINAQALIGLHSALDALVQQLPVALRDLPFLVRLDEAEKQVPEAVQHLTPELRKDLVKQLQKLLELPKLKQLKRKGVARYERRLRRVELGFQRPIPEGLDQALREIGVIRDLLIHRAGRMDREALDKAPSLAERYQDGELIRLSDEDYRMYSGAIRWYAAEVIQRLFGRGDDESDNWRESHISGA
jgi:hypothetical protein